MLILVTPDSNLAHFPLCLNHKSQQSPVLFSRPRSTCNFCFSRSVHRPSVLYGNVIFGVIDPQVHHNVFFIRLKLEHYSFSLQILFGTFLCSGVAWNICEIRAMAKRATLLQFFFLTALRRFVQWRDTMTVHTWLIWNCADSFPWEKKIIICFQSSAWMSRKWMLLSGEWMCVPVSVLIWCERLKTKFTKTIHPRVFNDAVEHIHY